ncbi:MAG: hypothetical protein ABIH41_00160 [Nanoarchaeota archaeon]
MKTTILLAAILALSFVSAAVQIDAPAQRSILEGTIAITASTDEATPISFFLKTATGEEIPLGEGTVSDGTSTLNLDTTSLSNGYYYLIARAGASETQNHVRVLNKTPFFAGFMAFLAGDGKPGLILISIIIALLVIGGIIRRVMGGEGIRLRKEMASEEKTELSHAEILHAEPVEDTADKVLAEISEEHTKKRKHHHERMADLDQIDRLINEPVKKADEGAASEESADHSVIADAAAEMTRIDTLLKEADIADEIADPVVDQLRAYITQTRQLRFSDEQIKGELERAGWPDELIGRHLQ